MKKVLFAIMLLVLVPSVLKAEIKPEPVSCSDYYQLGSVLPSINSESETTVSGTKLNFSGSIKNTNAYPIVNGKLFIKMLRKGGANDESYGMEEIGSFVAKDGISIPANSSVPTFFTWDVPAYLISGDYKAVAYFVVADKFDMSGLSYKVNDFVSFADFKVVGEQSKDLYFDRTKITLNGENYDRVSANPVIGANDKATVTLTIKNDTEEAQKVPVKLELYKWDAQSKDNLIKSEEIAYLVDPQTSMEISYVVEDTNHAVYYLIAKSSYKDVKSEVAVRFLREGKQEPRVSFSGLTKYPLEKGTNNAFVTCVQNSGNADADYGKVVATVYDSNGKAIYFSQYEGKISDQGFLSKFTPQLTYKNLTLETKIYDKSGKEIDKSSVVYKCSDFSQDCQETGQISDMTTKILLIGLVLIIILAFFAKKIKRV